MGGLSEQATFYESCVFVLGRVGKGDGKRRKTIGREVVCEVLKFGGTQVSDMKTEQ